MNKINLSIIIPVFNEEKTLLEILKKTNQLSDVCEIEIIVIDDCSTDNSINIIKDNKYLYSKSIFLEKNFGKGKVVIEGLKHTSGEYIVIQDADLEYEPQDLKDFISNIKKNNPDLIMGSRFIGRRRSVLHFWHMVGNKFITFLFNIINNTTFTDIYCCYCLFKRELIDQNKLRSHGWGQQAEILTYLVKKSKRILEIGVNYNARDYKEGKKIRYYDIFGVIYFIILTKFKTLF
jgi:glycosyltransferase involved in cell wall biosynthesis